MLKSSVWWASTACVVAALLAQPAFGQQATTFQPNQAVEVREGDEWSAATVVKKEGRKYQIKYADGTEEWVTTDRLRAPGDSTAPNATAGTEKPVAGGEKPRPNAPAKAGFQPAVGMEVEVKRGGSWSNAVVKVKGTSGWILVVYQRGGNWMEWVEPWRIRKLGDKTDDLPHAPSNRYMMGKQEPPPRNPPGPKPDPETKHDPFAPKAYDKPITEAQLVNAEDVLPSGAPAVLATFDGVPATTKLSKRSYVLKGQGDRFGGPDKVLFAGNFALVSYLGRNGGDTVTKEVERFDLASGNALGTMPFDPLSNPMAISPAGKRALGVAHGFFGGTRSRVDLFDLPATGSSEPKHVLSFQPYPGEKHATDVDWAAFVDEDHVLTLSSGGMLVLWNAPKATAVWRISVARNSRPALSPGGQQVAVMGSDDLHLLEARTGKVLATIPGSRPSQSLAFTSDGKRVVASTGTTISQWDLTKGELLGDIGVQAVGDSLAPVAPGYVLLGGSHLLDLDRKQTIWRYENGQKVTAHAGLGFAIVRDGERTILTTAEIPHPAALKAAAGMGEAALVVKPGDQVSLEVAIEGNEEQRQKIVTAITAQLKRNGISVAPNQPVKLFARTEQGATRTQTYERRNFGGFGGFGPPGREQETVSVTDKITRLYFEMDGKTLWESRIVNGTPGHLSIEEGQSINDAVQAASTYNLSFFDGVRVPAYIAKIDEATPLGVSRWSMGGVREER